jgi:hypothetical protein
MPPVGDDAPKALRFFFKKIEPHEGMKDHRSGSLGAVATRHQEKTMTSDHDGNEGTSRRKVL